MDSQGPDSPEIGSKLRIKMMKLEKSLHHQVMQIEEDDMESIAKETSENDPLNKVPPNFEDAKKHAVSVSSFQLFSIFLPFSLV